jgi:DNA polymerase (family 10)
MDAQTVAERLDEIATLLELDGENAFKVRAYQNGARAVRGLGDRLGDVVAKGELGEVEGIGETLREKITELVSTGRLEYLDKLRLRFPPGVRQMLRIPGLGPKRAKLLFEQVGITTLDALEQACQADRLLDVKGFGKKTQTNLLAGIAHVRTQREEFPVGEVLPLAEALLAVLRAVEGVAHAEMAGSLRRRRAAVHDADLLAAVPADPPARRRAVAAALTGHALVKQVLADGATKVAVRLQNGLQVDLRMVEPHEYPAALMYFTGSKAHNVKLRGIARDLGYTLNEYSLSLLDEEGRDTGVVVPAVDEAALYALLGFGFIPPTEREDEGELDAYRLPDGPRKP